MPVFVVRATARNRNGFRIALSADITAHYLCLCRDEEESMRVAHALIAAILAVGASYPLFAEDRAIGKVMLINEGNREITLHHGPLEELGLRSQSTTFRLENFDSLNGIALGDSVRFEAAKSGPELRLTHIEKTDQLDDDHHH